MIKEVEKFKEKIELFMSKIKYLSSPVIECILDIDNTIGKYYIIYSDEIESNNLSCGSPLEMFDQDLEKWVIGRVEHDGEYYFYDHSNKPRLYQGMKVRKRIEN